MTNRLLIAPGLAVLVLAWLAMPARAEPPHNVIIFVADGLRSRIVTPETAPDMAALRAEGVDFRNSHSLYPTLTTPNAAAIATGHAIGDTGDFGNTIHVGGSLTLARPDLAAALEDDAVLGRVNARFGGNYLGRLSLLQAARSKGYMTAAIGKLGPVAIQDVTARDGFGTIVIDDSTGASGRGVTLAPDIARAIQAAGLPSAAPGRGPNGVSGNFNTPGALTANVSQQDWFVGVATKVLLPRFKAQGKPFAMVFWSRDPDGSQHNQGDSLNALTPGINGPTSMAAIRNASNDLGSLRQALQALGLAETTDIVVTADHGFSTLSKISAGSASAKLSYPDVQPGLQPQGFLGIDLSLALGLPLHDTAGNAIDPRAGAYPKRGALIGADPGHPQVVVMANGGSDLIYLPGDDREMAAKVIGFLTTQDYTGALFVRDDLGPVPGALPMSSVGLAGEARTPRPAIVIGFASTSGGCEDPELCGVDISDTDLQQGQGTHGTFGRQDTHNFMAATGPDFRKGFVDRAPVSTADIALTLAHVLGLSLSPGGTSGRVLNEALVRGGPPPMVEPVTIRSQAAANGFVTVLNKQEAAGKSYYDAAGMPGRTVGLKP